MGWNPVAPHVFAVGDDLGVAANLNAWIKDVLANLNAAIGSVQSWTPVLTATGTNPNSNYTAVGTYVQNGNLVTARFAITINASFSAGSGTYLVSLPVTPAETGWQGAGKVIAGSNTVLITTYLISGNVLRLEYASTLTAVANVSNSAPGTWATGNTIVGTITYPAA